MKVILRADIDNLGSLGEIVNVKPGYGRNYLLPKGLAMTATKANQKVFEAERKKLQEKMDAIRFQAQEKADALNQAEVVIPVRVGEGDKLYGSVTTTTIGDALAAMGIEVDRKRLLLDEPIRELGEYTVQVRLHPEVRADLKVSVVRHDQEQGSEETQSE
ncbi:MAG: 50S ribosomal protein L9 [Desulfovibrionales bacterium]